MQSQRGEPGPDAAEEEVFENERYIPIRGWGSRGALLPGERRRYSSRSGARSTSEFPSPPLPPGAAALALGFRGSHSCSLWGARAQGDWAAAHPAVCRKPSAATALEPSACGCLHVGRVLWCLIARGLEAYLCPAAASFYKCSPEAVTLKSYFQSALNRYGRAPDVQTLMRN